MKHAAKRSPLKLLLTFVLILLAALVLAAGAVYLWMNGTVTNIQRLNEEGTLYSLDYTGNYYNPLARAPYQLLKGAGCTAFLTHDETGSVLTCRNYDFPHDDGSGGMTGLNVLVNLHPAGKYASVNMADAAWLSYLKIPYRAGALDDGHTTHALLAFLPYLCMDGMNEKGLTASILALDVKDGETAAAQSVAGLEAITINELCRFIIDSCATTEEAVALAKQYNMCGILGNDYHLFVTDASGASVVLEWRYDELLVTETDAVTNFYVGYDDAEDCYYDGQLKEAFPGAADTVREYHYGYGHGYGRFNTAVRQLDDSLVSGRADRYTEMSGEDALDVLKRTAQDYTGALTSYTQYSCVYNQTDLTLHVYVQQDYGEEYEFSPAAN